MKRETIEAEIKKEICKLIGSDYEISNETTIMNTGIESIDCIKLLINIEEMFDITFSDDDLMGVKQLTVGKLIDIVTSLCEA